MATAEISNSGSRPVTEFPPTLEGKPFSDYLEGLLVAAGVPTLRYAEGATIFDEGDDGDTAYFIRSGSIDILSKRRDGAERLLHRLGSGELFGEMALLNRAPRSAHALTRERAVLFAIPHEDVETLLRQVPQLALWMLKLLSHRLAILTRMSAEMEEVQEVNLKILAGQEKERRRIGRDIHDSVAQSFAAGIVRAQLAEQLLDRDVDRVRSELGDLQVGLRDGLVKTKELIHNLYPKELGHFGLVGAVERFLDRIAGSAGVEVSLVHQGLEQELAATLETMLYCIVQEALNNVIKHAKASKVRVALSREGQQLTMVVSDDGRGFNVGSLANDAVCENRYYGLATMEERAKLAGGTMQLESSPGAGTSLHFNIPVR